MGFKLCPGDVRGGCLRCLFLWLKTGSFLLVQMALSMGIPMLFHFCFKPGAGKFNCVWEITRSGSNSRSFSSRSGVNCNSSLLTDNTSAGIDTLYPRVGTRGGIRSQHTPVAGWKTSHHVFHGIGFQPGDVFTSQTFRKGNPPFGPRSWNPTPHRGALGAKIQAIAIVQSDRSFSQNNRASSWGQRLGRGDNGQERVKSPEADRTPPSTRKLRRRNNKGPLGILASVRFILLQKNASTKMDLCVNSFLMYTRLQKHQEKVSYLGTTLGFLLRVRVRCYYF